jgi:hypothetical protein
MEAFTRLASTEMANWETARTLAAMFHAVLTNWWMPLRFRVELSILESSLATVVRTCLVQDDMVYRAMDGGLVYFPLMQKFVLFHAGPFTLACLPETAPFTCLAKIHMAKRATFGELKC